jgi:antirestriction protein ArdC
MPEQIERKDVYSRINTQIVEYLEKGVRPWIRPWNAEHAAGRITRPLRHNGQPYSGINVLSLWMSALGQNFAAPMWMTFRQATELNAHVRKGEKGSLVVFANAITRTEHDIAYAQLFRHRFDEHPHDRHRPIRLFAAFSPWHGVNRWQTPNLLAFDMA